MNNLIAEYLQPLLISMLDFLPKLFLAVAILLIGSLIARRVGSLIYKRLLTHSRDKLTVQFLSRLASWGIMLFVVVLAMQVVGLGGFANSLLAGAGVSALVIGFALKDIGENLLSGIALSFRPPFAIGDMIETNNVKGEVMAIDIRTTHIRGQDGKDIYIPNSLILKSTLSNMSQRGSLRQELALTINSSSKLDEAIKLISATVKQVDKVAENPTIVVEDYAAEKVTLKVYYWTTTTKFHDVAAITNQVIRAAKDALIKQKLI
jgi:small-conductance mechanosensitive channel